MELEDSKKQTIFYIFSELYIGLKTATKKDKMQEKMLFEIGTLRKELSRCEEEKLANTL